MATNMGQRSRRIQRICRALCAAATLGSLTAGALGAVSALAAEAPATPTGGASVHRSMLPLHRVGIANPIVEYDSIEKMEMVLGFRPLELPRRTRYTCTSRAVIDGTVADLGYSSQDVFGEQRTTWSVRTAELADVRDTAGDISGVYGVSWQEEPIGNTQVYVAKVYGDTYAARWTNGTFAYAALASGIVHDEFLRLLRDELVAQTERR